METYISVMRAHTFANDQIGSLLSQRNVLILRMNIRYYRKINWQQLKVDHANAIPPKIDEMCFGIPLE